jgi:hypothetical protein
VLAHAVVAGPEARVGRQVDAGRKTGRGEVRAPDATSSIAASRVRTV